jgi:hypothetical protein
MQQGLAFVAPLGGHGGSAEREAFDPLDDLVIEHEATVTDRGGCVLDLGLTDQG